MIQLPQDDCQFLGRLLVAVCRLRSVELNEAAFRRPEALCTHVGNEPLHVVHDPLLHHPLPLDPRVPTLDQRLSQRVAERMHGQDAHVVAGTETAEFLEDAGYLPDIPIEAVVEEDEITEIPVEGEWSPERIVLLETGDLRDLLFRLLLEITLVLRIAMELTAVPGQGLDALIGHDAVPMMESGQIVASEGLSDLLDLNPLDDMRLWRGKGPRHCQLATDLRPTLFGLWDAERAQALELRAQHLLQLGVPALVDDEARKAGVYGPRHPIQADSQTGQGDRPIGVCQLGKHHRGRDTDPGKQR